MNFDKLQNLIPNLKTIHFDEIDSTNKYLSQQQIKSGEIMLCTADSQTQGGGRRGNKWLSQSKKNIYISMLINLKVNSQDVIILNFIVAVVIIKSLENLFFKNNNIKIKLPNDIYYKTKKLAGILIETKSICKNSLDVVIGFGLNCSLSQMQDLQDERAISSLENIFSQQISKEIIISEIVKNMILDLHNFEQRYFDLEVFSKYDYCKDKNISFIFENKKISGRYLGLSNQLEIKLKQSESINKYRIASISNLKENK